MAATRGQVTLMDSIVRAALVSALLVPVPMAAAQAIDLAPHRAFYELGLSRADIDSGVAEATGRLVVDWSQSCDGWTVDQRLALIVVQPSGQSITTEIVFSSFESLDGLTYSFTTKTTRDGTVVDEFRGEAGRADVGEAVRAIYSVPTDTRRELPADTVFPMEHLRLLLDAAMNGENRLFRPFFDGPRPDESPFDANALIIGGPNGADSGAAVGLHALTDRPWWPVQIAFFPHTGQAAEPDFELAADLQDNGVVRRYLFDYGAFQVGGDLSRIEAGTVPTCND